MNRRGLNIAILSFDRPRYLERVIASLAPQLCPNDRCYLFQDGCWNRFSGVRYATPECVKESIAVFRRLLPDSDVFLSSTNLGIAGNYRRAEELMFEAHGLDEALFLEDDLVLSPDYLDVTVDLLDIASESRHIGYVSAYGDFWASLTSQELRAGELQPMHENWGSALTRMSWLRQRPVREMYWSLVANCDSRLRDSAKIISFYEDLGYHIPISSQDASRWVACVEQDMLRLTTRTCHSIYIGETGVHFTPAHYKKYRFEHATMFPRRPVIRVPTAEAVDAWIIEQRRIMKRRYAHSYLHPDV